MHKRLHPFLPFVVILFGLLAYVGSFGGTFLLDDNAHIANSSSIRNLGSYINHSSRPLAALSFHLNYLLSGSDPTDYHAVNLVIHLGAALLLYGIVRRTLQSPLLVARYGSFSYLIALFAAILWAVHPVQTGSVTYVVQRAESMMGFFYLLALYCFARGIGPGRNAAWFVCATAACGLGMGAKAVMVTAPLVLLLYDRTFFAGSAGKALRLRWPAYAGLAATWGILAFLVLRPHESAATTGLSVKGMTPLTYLATQQGVICHYLKLVVWPKDLCLDYAWPPALTVSHMLPYAVAVGVLVLLAAVLTFRRHPAGFCLAWFLIVLAPSSSIIPIADYAFEHRLYLPVAGLASLFAGSIVMLVNRLLRKRESTVRVALASSALVLAVAAALTVRTVDRNKDYASFIRITRSNVRIRPHNFRVRTMLIDALMGELDFPGAEEEAMRLVADVEKALQSRDRLYATSASNPSYYLPAAINMAGVALLCRGRNEEALPLMVRALQLRPGFEKARYNLAVTLFGLGRYDDAMKEALRSIELSSDSSKAHMLAGMILVKTGTCAAIYEGETQLPNSDRRATTNSLPGRTQGQPDRWSPGHS